MNQLTTHYRNTRDRISRVSWGAIFAGALTAITVLIVLNLLGLGIGLTSIDPMTDAQPLDGVGTWTVIYWIATSLASLFIGGMVAGRMSGLPTATDGGLHGFMAWGVHLILGIFILTSVVGSVLGGIGSLASGIFGGDDQQEVLVNIDKAKEVATENSNFGIEQFKKELIAVIENAENKDILPNDASEETNQTINNASQEIEKALDNLDLDTVVSEFINDINVDLDTDGNLSVTVEGDKDYINEQGIKDYLTDNTSLSDAEINGLIERWNEKIDTAIEKAKATYQKAKKEALIAAEKISDRVGTYSIYLFFLLLLGAGASFAGGALGSPYLTVSEEHDDDLINDERTHTKL
ncbi:TIGR04086 family membrane protein [Nonlabens antarcticus]|uniref:TIGR04086 family membrane protein n=1 Tax=Nonlabens antarcticus TaxID=392714 RepID=UPI0018914717|nr:TIGR04086 family membrane protein [Nonlabens antarcticus]